MSNEAGEVVEGVFVELSDEFVVDVSDIAEDGDEVYVFEFDDEVLIVAEDA